MSQALMDEEAVVGRALPQPESRRTLGLQWLPALVVLAATAAGISLYAYFCQHSRELWWAVGHDRHTHYTYGLNLALDIKTGDVARLLHDVDRMRVWGPLHPVLIAILELAGGLDHRLAVLPSLIGWIVTMWCAFLIPRRLLPNGGNFAGLAAAFFVAVSPAHRAFATDVMYESLGAGLSLAVIYLYLATVQEHSHAYAVGLGLALSALFLHKYNYWILTLAGVLAGEFLRQPRAWLEFGVSLYQRDRLPAWLLAELKQPLHYITLALAAAAIYVAVTGGGVVAVGRWSFSVTEPHNLVHLAYIAFFVRLSWWWLKAGRTWSLQWPAALRSVLVIHGSVVAVWFLMPKRLSYFLWYLSPGNDDLQRESVPFLHGLPFYLRGMAEEYVAQPWCLYLLGGLLILAVAAWPRWKAGSAVVFCFLLASAYLTFQHPMEHYRFMHSWIAAMYVLGAAGAVFAAQQLVTPIARTWQPRAAAACCALLAGVSVPALFEPGHAQEGGLKPDQASPLKITETYLPALADARNPTIISNVATRFLWTWTFAEYHGHQNMSAEIKNFKTFEGNPGVARRWLETTQSDALVLIDIRPNTTYDWKRIEYVDLAAFHQALADQKTWVRAESWEMSEGVSITLWRKSPGPMSASLPDTSTP